MEELTEKKIIQAVIMRVMVRIAQYTCPEGEEIDTIEKWLKKTVVRQE